MTPMPPLSSASIDNTIAIQSADIRELSADSSAASTPWHKFMLIDLALKFPEGQLTLVCCKLGSRETLLLLGASYDMNSEMLLNVFNSVTRRGGYPHGDGQIVCPGLPPDALACFANQKVTREDWIVPGV